MSAPRTATRRAKEGTEHTVGPDMANYLDAKSVKCLDPVRIGHAYHKYSSGIATKAPLSLPLQYFLDRSLVYALTRRPRSRDSDSFSVLQALAPPPSVQIVPLDRDSTPANASTAGQVAGHRMLMTLGHAVGDSDGRLESEGSMGLTGCGREPEDAAPCWLRGRERGEEALIIFCTSSSTPYSSGVDHEDALFQPPSPAFRLPPLKTSKASTLVPMRPHARATPHSIYVSYKASQTPYRTLENGWMEWDMWAPLKFIMICVNLTLLSNLPLASLADSFLKAKSNLPRAHSSPQPPPTSARS
ncbi:hypothetical protein EDB86DRAFT_3134751 [Lactarius hatsudake]|nr:hypothetical protein EDB86DRAFT_3134751 [Lactarius hatsudake]